MFQNLNSGPLVRMLSSMPAKQSDDTVDQNVQLEEDMVHLARVSIAGKVEDSQVLLRRMARRYRSDRPDLAKSLTELLRGTATRSSPLRRAATPAPVDSDSRLELLRVNMTPLTSHEPVWDAATQAALGQLVLERSRADLLRAEGLQPARTALFVGPPGVGKTLTATWVAEQLGLPLFVLDLSAVMNSLLGKTGTNLRLVLDYARSNECVLFLDELDAVAKRRDDHAEVGELKRLVTVLLQEIDHWPSEVLMLAATNHSDLLDPAIWRRFDLIVEFELPELDSRRRLLEDLLGESVGSPLLDTAAISAAGRSFADIERMVNRVRRRAVLNEAELDGQLLEELLQSNGGGTLEERRSVARSLLGAGYSQRKVAELTGMGRDTVRKLQSDSTERMT